jgi:hypothetical protein
MTGEAPVARTAARVIVLERDGEFLSRGTLDPDARWAALSLSSFIVLLGGVVSITIGIVRMLQSDRIAREDERTGNYSYWGRGRERLIGAGLRLILLGGLLVFLALGIAKYFVGHHLHQSGLPILHIELFHGPLLLRPPNVRRRATRAARRRSSSRPAGVPSSSAATWRFGSASSTSRTPKVSCECARSTPSWSGSRTSTSRSAPRTA